MAIRRRAEHARLLDGAVDGNLAGDVDHRREAFQAEHRDAPRGAARRSSRPRAPPRGGGAERAPRWSSSALAGSAAARPRAGRASPTRGRARPRRCRRPAWRAVRRGCAMPGHRVVVLGDRERDALERGERRACRGAARRGSARSRAARPASRRGRRGSSGAGRRRTSAPLSTGTRALGRSQLVVDVEAADLGLGHGDLPWDPGRRRAIRDVRSALLTRCKFRPLSRGPTTAYTQRRPSGSAWSAAGPERRARRRWRSR